jgi:hypothetical protein
MLLVLMLLLLLLLQELGGSIPARLVFRSQGLAEGWKDPNIRRAVVRGRCLLSKQNELRWIVQWTVVTQSRHLHGFLVEAPQRRALFAVLHASLQIPWVC